MKKVSIILIAVGMASFCFAQNYSSNFDLSKFKGFSTDYSNSEYLNEVQNSLTPNQVRFLENIVSNGDVTKSKKFDGSKGEELEVTFKSDYGYVVASYDDQGKLIMAVERCKDFALPGSTSLAIVKQYPNWSIVKSRYSILYTRGNRTMKNFKVKIKKENQKKWIRIDMSGNIL